MLRAAEQWAEEAAGPAPDDASPHDNFFDDASAFGDEEWATDGNDADGVMGFGIEGQDCCPMGAGWTNYVVSDTANVRASIQKRHTHHPVAQLDRRLKDLCLFYWAQFSLAQSYPCSAQPS